MAILAEGHNISSLREIGHLSGVGFQGFPMDTLLIACTFSCDNFQTKLIS